MKLSDQAGGAASSSKADETGWKVLAPLMLATVIANVASVCLFPQIVVLSTEFGRPVNEVVWTMVAFSIIATGVGGVAAALGAVVGNRRMLTIVLGLLLVGSLVAALSTSVTLLIVARAIQGVGMATQALSIGIIANHWRGDSMRRAISLIILSIGLGAVIGFLLGGFIWRGGGDWRTVFWILSGATALPLFLTVTLLKESKRVARVPIDYVGCVGVVVWSALVLVPLSQANAWGWGSAKVLGLLLSGLALLVLWILWELRSSAPLLDLRLLRRMGVWQGAVVWVAVTVAMCVPAAAIPYLFQTPTASGFGFGRSIFVVSLALAVPAVVMTLLSPTTTSLMRRLGAKGTILLGALFGLSGFGMAFAHGSVWMTLVWLAGTGVMGGWVTSASYAVAAEAVPPEKGIIVSTIYNTMGGLGTAVGAAAAGYVLSLRQVGVQVSTPGGLVTEHFPAEQSFTWSAMIVGAAALVGMASVLTIRSKRLRVEGREPIQGLM